MNCFSKFPATFIFCSDTFWEKAVMVDSLPFLLSTDTAFIQTSESGSQSVGNAARRAHDQEQGGKSYIFNSTLIFTFNQFFSNEKSTFFHLTSYLLILTIEAMTYAFSSNNGLDIVHL